MMPISASNMRDLIIVFAAILIIVLFLGILAPNTHNVSDFNLFWITSYGHVNLSLIILASIFCGFLLGIVLFGALYFRISTQKSEVDVENKRLADELQRQRRISLDQFTLEKRPADII